ncbi:MAG: HD domain-containing protein [Anaerolineales bacterium]
MSSFARLVYRSRQFWLALTAPRSGPASAQIAPYLSPAQQLLFRRLQPAEQAHAFLVLQRLRQGGQQDPDLMTAALLHDVGKVLSPLSLFDRVLIVLGRRFLPRLARRWEAGEPRGLRRPFVVAARHAEWGAALAAEAGASARAVDLIRRHQEALPAGDSLLAALQAADDEF